MIDEKHFRYLAWRWFRVAAIRAARFDVRSKIVALLLLPVLLACTPEPTLHGDVTFTSEERAAIEGAAAFMAERTGNEAPAIVWDARHVGPTDACERETIVRRERMVGLDGMMVGKEGCLYLNAALDPDRFQAVAAHELGHWFGVGHHDELGIMNVNVSATMRWTDADERVCHRAKGRCKYQGKPEAVE